MPVLPLLSLNKLKSFIKSRIRSNSDAVICISGFEGVGKSNLAMILSYLLDADFSLENNILYSPNEEELLTKIKTFKKGSVLNLDEAVKVLEKQNWSKQTFIKQIFQVIRGKNLITLLLIPRLEDLNEYFRNWRVILNICVTHRGLAYLQVPDPYNKFDVWQKKFNQNVIDYTLKGETFHTAPLSDVMYAVSKFKGFVGFVTFPKLPKYIEDKYIVLKDLYAMENFNEDDGSKSKFDSKMKKKVDSLTLKHSKNITTITNRYDKKVNKYKKVMMGTYDLLIKTGLSQNKIALQMGMSRHTLRTMLGQDS